MLENKKNGQVKEQVFPELQSIYNAKRSINNIINQTPLIHNFSLSEHYKANIYFKREDLQKTRSYKIRGAYHKMSLLNKEQMNNGIVCASAGNHAQGVALSCYELGIKGKIYMPVTTPKQKIKQVKMYGKDKVDVILLGDTLHEAKAAADLGVKIFEQSRVVSISHDDKPTVFTEQGSVKASYVVLCGNAYMENLVPKLASRVLPSNSSVIATAPLSDALVQKLLPGDCAVCDPRTALDYFRLTADKRMLFGGLSNYTGLEPSDLTGTMRTKMLQVFPQLDGISIDYGWSGQMGIGLNRMPQLGRLSNNVFYIQAYSGHGVAPTHIMGRIIAEMISGTAGRFFNGRRV